MLTKGGLNAMTQAEARMTPQIDAVFQAALSLPPDSRAELANKLLASVGTDASVQQTPTKRWTVDELLKLPVAQRGPILRAAAAAAEQEYRTNPDLTAFGAFGEDDLYVDDSDAE